MSKRWLAVGAVLFLLAFTVLNMMPPRAKPPFRYGVYGGGPPYFEPTPVPEPACFCIAGVITLSLIIIRNLRRKL